MDSPAANCYLLNNTWREIRDLIYEEVLYDPEGLQYDIDTNRIHSKIVSVSLLLVCKQIHVEARDLVYKINRPTFSYSDVYRDEPLPSKQFRDYVREPKNFNTLRLSPVLEIQFSLLQLAALWPYQASKSEQIAEQYIMGEIGRLSTNWKAFHPAQSHPKARMEIKIITRAGFLRITGNALAFALTTLSWASVFNRRFVPSLVVMGNEENLVSCIPLRGTVEAITAIRIEHCKVGQTEEEGSVDACCEVFD